MKRFIATLMIVALTGCTSATQFGPCVGAFDEKKPDLEYKVSGWNLAMALIFFELVAPPIQVVVDETFCPVGKK